MQFDVLQLKKYEEKHKGTAKKYEPQYIKLFRRMQVYQEDHLRYVTDFRVPYTNNEAERGCRVIKTKKNVSRQFKSKEGVDAYASIWKASSLKTFFSHALFYWVSVNSNFSFQSLLK